MRKAWYLPSRFQMAEPVGDEQKIEIALTDNLVGDVDAVFLRIAGLREHLLAGMCHAFRSQAAPVPLCACVSDHHGGVYRTFQGAKSLSPSFVELLNGLCAQPITQKPPT